MKTSGMKPSKLYRRVIQHLPPVSHLARSLLTRDPDQRAGGSDPRLYICIVDLDRHPLLHGDTVTPRQFGFTQTNTTVK